MTLAGWMLTGCDDFDCCMPGVISVAPDPVYIGGTEGATEVLDVICPMAWTLTGLPLWLSAPTSGTTGATITLEATHANPTPPRSATLTFTAANGDKAKVTVTQLRVVSETSLSVGTAAPANRSTTYGTGGEFTYPLTVSGIAAGTHDVTLSGAHESMAATITIGGAGGTLKLSVANTTPAGGYTLIASFNGVESNSFPFAVSRKSVTITAPGITKFFDGNNNVTQWGALDFNGLVNGETASVDPTSVTATYNNMTIGTGKAISSSGWGMTGGTANPANYSISAFGISGAITLPPEPLFTGTGVDAANAYQIDNVVQLALLAQLVNANNTAYNSKYYKLTNNIDLNDAPYMAGVGWTIIGTVTNYFHGHFDGGGHTFSNLFIDLRTTRTEIGLFGRINGGSVRNLGLVNVNIAGYGYVGGISGNITNGAVISNCYVTGAITYTNSSGSNPGQRVGGIAGSAANGTITNCFTTCTVQGVVFVGGVAGNAGGTITHCYATGNIQGNSIVGGVVGRIESGGEIAYCVALNSSVIASSYIAWRVAFFLSGALLSNNYGNDLMTVEVNGVPNTLGKAQDSYSGEDCDPKPALSWWEGLGSWDFTNIWTMGTDGYPKLRVF